MMPDVAASFLGLIPLLFGFGFSFPVSLPPLPPDTAVEAVAPETCLFYTSWTGIAEAQAGSANQTEAFLAEPEIRGAIAYVKSALHAGLLKTAGANPEAQAAVDQGMQTLETVYTRPMALYVADVKIAPNAGGPPQVELRAGLVVNAGDGAGALEQALHNLESLLLGSIGAPGPVKEATVGGVRYRRLPTPAGAPGVSWGFKGELLLVAVGEPEEAWLAEQAGGDRQPPAWLAKLYEQTNLERRACTSYVNVGAIRDMALAFVPDPQVKVVLDELGLTKLDSLGSVSGLDGEGMAGRTVLTFDGELPPLFASLAGEPLTPADLQPIPADANFSLVGRFSLSKAYEQTMATLEALAPPAADQVRQALPQVEAALGVRLVEDLLAPWGDVWRLYNSPGQGGSLLTGVALVVDVRDVERLRQTHQALLDRATPLIEQANAAIRQSKFAGVDVFTLQVKSAEFPLAISWCIGDRHFMLALNPQMIKARLSAPDDEKSLADVPVVRDALASANAPCALSYTDVGEFLPALYSLVQYGAAMAAGELGKQGIDFDLSQLPSYASIGRHAGPSVTMVRRLDNGFMFEHRQTLPLGNAELTSSLPIVIALALPAVQAARAAARRTQQSNNLRQIGLALLNYEGVHRRFPPSSNPKNFDAQGRPLLGWRVHILPFLEQQALYDEFHLDEPWDSPHNRQLIDRMPTVFGSTTFPQVAAEGKTVMLMPRGKGTIGEEAQGIEFAQVQDGLSNTIVVVEAAPSAAVAWTSPDDLNFDVDDPLAGLVGSHPGGFQVLFGDGSVRFISQAIAPETLKLLMDPRDGRAIPADALDAPAGAPPRVAPEPAATRPKGKGPIKGKAPAKPKAPAAKAPGAKGAGGKAP